MSVASRLFFSGALRAALNPGSRSNALLASGACAVALLAAPVAHSATIFIQILDNGVLVATTSSSTGSAHLTDTTAPGFTSISVDAVGLPDLPGGDLSSTALSVSAAATTIAHTLAIDIFQTGVSVPAPGRTDSTFSVNNLIGSTTIGPTVETTFWGGTSSTFGTKLASDTFPAGTQSVGAGPFAVLAGAAFTSDAEQYVVPFAANPRAQSANDTIELTTSIPEIPKWAMLLLGFGGLGYAVLRRTKSERKQAAIT
jgi:hypothetical protein